MKTKILILFVLIVFYNLIFFLQNIFDNELQFYVLGFRLNLFLLVNFGIIYSYREKFVELANYFKRFGRIKNWLLVFLIPIIISSLTLGLINLFGFSIEFKRPNFSIEFGVSSLIDLPIYYLWNLPFLLSCIVVITLILNDFKFLKVILISLSLSLCFVFVQPISAVEKIDFKLFSFIPLIFGMMVYNLTILRTYKSLWLTIFSILISIYSFVLVFGSSNAFVIKTFFARMYSDWDGLFVFKKFDIFLIDLFYAGLMILFAILFFIFDKKKNDNL